MIPLPLQLIETIILKIFLHVTILNLKQGNSEGKTLRYEFIE